MATESYFDAISCEFSENYANDTSTIDVLGSSITNNITITGCSFEKNQALKNTISLMRANVVIDSGFFSGNKAETRSKNLFIGFSTVLVRGCTFKSPSLANPSTKVLLDST